MARISIRVLHDPGDSQGVVVVQGNASKELSQGENQEFVLGPEGIKLNVKAVDSRGVPLNNQPSPAATPGMSRTDPRPPQGAPSTELKSTPPANNTENSQAAQANAGSVNPVGSTPSPNPPAHQGPRTAQPHK